MARRPTAAQVAASLLEPHPGQSADLAPADVLEDTTVFLSPDEIDLYDDNPRQAPNPAEAELRASLLAKGYDGQLAVTRRPGSSRYVVAGGSNTLLRLIKEFHDAGDERFAQLHCRAKPWVSETRVLLDHMIENVRGDLIFIDKARSVARARQLLEQESGESLSARQLADTLTERGYKIDNPSITRYDFAIAMAEYLPQIFASGAGHAFVKELRKIDNAIEALCRARQQEDKADDALSGWRAHLAEYDTPERGALDTQRALQDYTGTLSAMLGEPLQDTRMDVFTLLDNPDYEAIAARYLRPPESTTGTESEEENAEGADDAGHADLPPPPPQRRESERRGGGGAGRPTLDNLDLFGDPPGIGDEVGDGIGVEPPGRSPGVSPSVAPEGQDSPPRIDPPPAAPATPADGLAFRSWKDARAKLFTAALALANATGLHRLIQPTGNCGAGFYMETPTEPLSTVPHDPAPGAWWLLHTASRVEAAQHDPDLVRVLSRSRYWELSEQGRNIDAIIPMVGDPMLVEEMYTWLLKLGRHAPLVANLMDIWTQVVATASQSMGDRSGGSV